MIINKYINTPPHYEQQSHNVQVSMELLKLDTSKRLGKNVGNHLLSRRECHGQPWGFPLAGLPTPVPMETHTHSHGYVF